MLKINALIKMNDLNKSEYLILTSLAIPTIIFGFYPDPLINTIEVSVNDLIKSAAFLTKDLLQQELEIKLAELEEKWHFSSLEKIFIEKT